LWEDIAMSLAKDDIGKGLLKGLVEALQNKGNISIEDIAGIFEQVASSVKAEDARIDAFLRSEIIKLANYISEAKAEILAITPTNPAKDDADEGSSEFFNAAGAELNAVVEATENATNAIMDATDAIIDSLKKAKAPEALQKQIGNYASNIFDACSFQDITGQRINKVIKTLNFVEAKIAKIARLFGNDDEKIVQIAGQNSDTILHDARPDAELMNGPQFSGKGVSQSDIDALFD
jgi:chemotaxis protein CheZ